MSKGAAKEKAKALKKEKAVTKARRKAIIIIGIFALVIVAAAAVGINIRKQNHKAAAQEELYAYRGQTVQLLADGTFSASLAHNVLKNGTYTKTEENGRTRVAFLVSGREEAGFIINNSLHIPHEWEDGHSHGNVFPKSK